MSARLPFWIAATVLAASGFAGCLDAGNQEGLVDDATKGALDYAYYTLEDFPIDIDHDHRDPALHTENFQVEFESVHACTPDGKFRKGQVSGFTDIAFHNQFAFVGTGDGFCILDVADPLHPVFVSHYEGESSADIEVTADGSFVFLLTQRTAAPGPLQRGSTDPTDNLPRGVIVVNVKDKKNPQFETYYQVLTNGVHTAVAYQMGNRQLLSIQTYDWVPPVAVNAVPQQNAPITQRIEITELKPAATGRMNLEFLSRYSFDRPPTDPLAQMFPHDSYIQKHPLTGQTLEYVAYWDAGLIILDISNPSAPKFVSQYNDKAPSKYNQYHDVKVSEELIDGRHITVTGPELPAAVGEVGHYRVFDTTDPKKPVQLGTWTLPGVPGYSEPFLFSPHVFQLVNGHLYIGHNHGGVWIVDLHNETLLKHPMTAGYYFPHGDERDPANWQKAVSVWGAYVHDGYLYATETTQGVHVLKWIGDAAPEPAAMMAVEPQH